MIDLHCHSNHSDGTYSVIELLKKAEEASIKTLSITDHDSVGAYNELASIDVKKYYSGEIIIGAEFNCVFNNCKIELLGYNFDKAIISKWLNNLYGKDKIFNSMQKEFLDMVAICEKSNVKITKNLKYDPKTEYPVDVIYNDVIKYQNNKNFIDDEAWGNRAVFFRRCTTDKNFILYRDFTKSLPKASEVARLIRDNGGKVFLAHLFTYKMDNHIDFLNKITEEKILDGVECYYSKFSIEQIKELVTYCDKNNLYKSGGSDCHGEKHPDIKLGIGYGDLKVNREAIEEWI